MNQPPDTRMSLLHRVRDSGDREAWEEFVEIYEPLVYRLGRRCGLQDADAREITQEAMVAVAGAIDRWEPTAGRGSFRSWLRRIARNLAINFLAKQGRQSPAVGGTEMLRWLDQQPAPSSGAIFDEEYRRQLFRRAAEKTQSAFEPKTWQAFWRTCVDGETVAEVARDLDMPVGSVYAARSRVTARLNDHVRKLEANG